MDSDPFPQTLSEARASTGINLGATQGNRPCGEPELKWSAPGGSWACTFHNGVQQTSSPSSAD